MARKLFDYDWNAGYSDSKETGEETKESRQKQVIDLATAIALALTGIETVKAQAVQEHHNEGLKGLASLPFNTDAPASLLPDFAQEPKKGKAKAKFLGWEIGR